MPSDATYTAGYPAGHAADRDRLREATEPALMTRASWSAIFIGAVIAAALMVVFDLLGVGIGLLALDLDGEGGAGLTGFTTGAVIWIVLTSILATAVGGYVAGRSAGANTALTASVHGAAVWAVSTLVVAVGTWVTGGAVASSALSGVRTATEQVASATAAVIPDDVSMPNIALPEFSTDALPAELQTALRERDLTIEQVRAEARAVARDVISRQEQRRAAQALSSGVAEAIASPGQAMTILQTTVNDLVGNDGVLSEADLEEARRLMRERLGISAQEAERLVDRWSAQITEAVDVAQQRLVEARETALETAETAVSNLATASLVAALVAALALGGGIGGAMAGRPQPFA